MNLLSSVSIPAVVGFVILIFIIFLILFVLRRNRKTNPDQVITPISNDPAVSLSNVTPTPVKGGDTKYLVFIVLGSMVAILIPLIALVIVRSQPKTTAQIANESVKNPVCRAVTITDTLNNPLSSEALTLLRPGDEIKILIATDGTSSEKARFRVNGSQWQEVTIKSGNNFVGNYILDSGFKKFTIEAEIFDKEKGWL